MARKLPSLNALRAFEAVGRLGRMTLAADELHVTHGAISRQVRHLEAVLGVPLLEGPRNAQRLTEAGRLLLPGLRMAFEQMEAAVTLVADQEDGPLDVSCIGTFTMRWLIPRLHRFQARHPAIDVRLASSDDVVNFTRDGFDLAIRIGCPPWPEGAEVTRLFPEAFGPVMAAGDHRAEDLRPVLRTRTRISAWEDWSALSGWPIPPGPTMEYEHFYFMLEAATGGLGVGMAPWPHVADDVRSGRLVAPLGFIPSGKDYVALRRRRKHVKSEVFVAWLRDEAARFERDRVPPGGSGRPEASQPGAWGAGPPRDQETNERKTY